CSYLDFHEGNPTIKRELANWVHKRPQNAHRNPSADVSELSLEWLQFEFPRFVNGRRCLFVGAEASLLKELRQDPEYRRVANGYWPADIRAFFLQTGRIGGRLDDIKREIADAIRLYQIDTAFISLGGAAKIICYELADELQISAFDFGGLMR